MTIKTKLNPTIADYTSRMTQDNRVDPDIVEVLTETNEMLEDITMVEANGPLEHRTTVRTGLPPVAWRKLNYGVQPTKSETKQVKDSMGILEAWARVDADLAQLNGMAKEWRFSEETAFIEAMSQAYQRALIYGDNTKDPEQILGLAPRFCEGDKKKAANAVNVLDAGGRVAAGKASDLTSIYLVGWSPSTVFCTFPKGSTAGLVQDDKGKTTVQDENGGSLDVFQTKYQWKVGLVVRDWRYVVRIANISLSELKADPLKDGGPDLIALLRKARNRLPNRNGGVARLGFYANRDVIDMIEAQAENRKNVRLTLEQTTSNNTVEKFSGIPLRVVDAIDFNEKEVKFPA